jgi:ABC-type uncharacterized transport system substrate-binding protein
MHNEKVIICIGAVLVVMLLSGCTTTVPDEGAGTTPEGEEEPVQSFKILHIMSYHSPWKWTDDQLEGFKKAFEDAGVDVEYRVYQMDTKRQTSEEWIDEVTREAKDLIDSWKPDLVYTNDDNAQKYVMKDYVNTETPHVFSAVNSDPSVYGFAGSSNVAGVMEEEHSVETINLLRELVPGVKKIAVVFDEGATWPAVKERMEGRIESELPEVEVVSWDTIGSFEVFKQKMNEYQDSADAVGLIGIFTFKDENGTNVPYEDVLEWVAENSNLPDFSFWADRISYGTLCAMTVSGYEQGAAAGEIAKGILVDGKSPSSFPFEPTVKGEPYISLARANKLNLSVKSDLLLTAEIVESFAWED